MTDRTRGESLIDAPAMREFAEHQRASSGDDLGPMFFRDVVRLCDAYERLEHVLYPDSPQRGDASGEDGDVANLAGLPSASTDASQCHCKWGASGAHHEGCPCHE